MHIFIIELTENNKVSKVQTITCSYHLNKFIVSFYIVFSLLSDNFRRNCLLTSPLMWCSLHLQGKQFQITRNKTTYFHMYISISEFIIPLCCRYQVVQSWTCREYSKNIQFMATSLYYNPTTYTYTSCDYLRNI